MEAIALPDPPQPVARRRAAAQPGSPDRRGGAIVLPTATDERLVHLAAGSDESAFEVLYERYSTVILRYLRRRVGSEQEAEDLHQQVFLSAYSALTTGVEPLHFKAWLYRIAHNVSVSELRSRRPATEQLDEERGLTCLRSDAALQGRESLRELIDDMAMLSRPQSTALLLREVCDLSYAEISELQQVPVGAVRSNIFRARVSLQALAAAREAECSQIRSELERLAGRRGRRSAAIAYHLRVCPSCEAFRKSLLRRSVQLAGLPAAG